MRYLRMRLFLWSSWNAWKITLHPCPVKSFHQQFRMIKIYVISVAPVRDEDCLTRTIKVHNLQLTSVTLWLLPLWWYCVHGSKSVHGAFTFHISADISGNKMALKALKPKLMAIHWHVIHWRRTDCYVTKVVLLCMRYLIQDQISCTLHGGFLHASIWAITTE